MKQIIVKVIIFKGILISYSSVPILKNENLNY